MTMYSPMPFARVAAARCAALGVTAAVALAVFAPGTGRAVQSAVTGGSSRVAAATPAPGDLEWD